MSRSERSPVLAGLLAFTSGAAYEGCSVVWVHQATHGSALGTAVVSCVQAAAQVVGIGESVKNWRTAPLFVLGYGFGAWLAMSTLAGCASTPLHDVVTDLHYEADKGCGGGYVMTICEAHPDGWTTRCWTGDVRNWKNEWTK